MAYYLANREPEVKALAAEFFGQIVQELDKTTR
jgi:hypothetical protein